MFTTTASKLKIGDVFTTQADQGAVWFRVIGTETRGRCLVLSVVVSCNPESEYTLDDSKWMDLDFNEEVVVRF
jgi:hypothetical protein